VSTVAVITGIQLEAECFIALTQHLSDDDKPYVYCAGPGPDRAAVACGALDGRDIAGIVSFGVAGGLDPSLAAGQLLLPSAIITSDNAMVETDGAWRRAVIAALPSPPPSTVHFGVDRPVTKPQEKARLLKEYGTHAVDMESHVIAHYAKSRGLPCLIVRAVADTADDTIPDAALAGVDDHGTIVPLQVVRRLVPHPTQLPSLMRLAKDSKAAMQTLKEIPRPAIDTICRAGPARPL
jgi:adenosylhomocysteine nucleosidase